MTDEKSEEAEAQGVEEIREEGREEERGGEMTPNKDELLKLRVAATIRRIQSDVPEPLRPYLKYQGTTPEHLPQSWYPRELVADAPGADPVRFRIEEDRYGILVARVDETKKPPAKKKGSAK
jgi:hypothetical protein